MNKTARQLRKLEARRLRNRKKQVPSPTPPVTPTPTPIPHTRNPERSDSTSPAKLAANRANALLSTGPRTEEGKAISSRNNTRHGLAGDFALLPNENRADFDQLVASLIAEHDPQTPTERVLIQDMAQHHWLLERALNLQTNAIAAGDHKVLSLYIRYQTTHQRAFHKCLNELLRLRKQRLAEARGFESQILRAAREQRAHTREQRAIELHNSRLETENRRRDQILARAERQKFKTRPAAA